jgi:hypothetical protein
LILAIGVVDADSHSFCFGLLCFTYLASMENEQGGS